MDNPLVNLKHRRILLGITGGIAAYKAAELTRRFQDHGADVRVIMTRSATEFITPLTMQALSKHPVHLDLLNPDTESVMGHIELARWADLILIAPASANFLARFASGHGDDLLTTVCLAAECPVAIAPAMNQAMWAKTVTQTNRNTLLARGAHILGPDEGLQACGEIGAGRLMAVDDLILRSSELFSTGTLQGKTVVITAGPTREAIDPVRYISNHSSGKQGYALAEAASNAGAEVILVSGPTHLDVPERVHRIDVISAIDMHDAVQNVIDRADIFIGVAAVADYRPKLAANQKIKKDQNGHQSLLLEFVENPDIIKAVATRPNRPFTVGFAAETQRLETYARQKLVDKQLDMVVANNVGDTSIGFNADVNAITIVTNHTSQVLPLMSKRALSERLIELIAAQISHQG
ncbi:MAG: bifunctional phosphopantothenoylcysteine decarboxylase/phosphopantothenate--cysteine ligase CoaBC [Proteobacteria bacterium]|nr:bifunctional phosphopantothenoylcysteine decarboxylase/phosphopantothenate--cysteine ligase CoaBC [Pseudomonadota bacterium]